MLFGFAFQIALAQSDLPSPKSGETYPVGTRLKAVCKPALAHEISVWTNFQKWDDRIGGFGGINTLFDPVVDSRTCSAIFESPGRYRMVIVRGRWSHDEGHEIVAEFTIREATPCDAKSNRIVYVRDGNGKDLDEQERKALGLGSDTFMSGQTVGVPNSIPKGIEIQFFDDSIIRISKGSKLRINNCANLAPMETSASVKLTLLLGKIWARIAPDADVRWQIETARAVDGNRGTTFSTEYDPATETTTVVVEEGSAWLRNRFGKIRTITIEAGQTGTQTMNQPPVLKRS